MRGFLDISTPMVDLTGLYFVLTSSLSDVAPQTLQMGEFRSMKGTAARLDANSHF